MTRIRAPLAVAVAVLAVACAEDPEVRLDLGRTGRFGLLRDLVLYDRPEAHGGAFFLDRFESTWADWAAWYEHRQANPSVAVLRLWGAEEPPPERGLLPISHVTLGEARAFARWRFGRLPRFDEWLFAATDYDRYQFPWGDVYARTLANTADLGVGSPTLVGTFEAGRSRDGPYDLIGNVSEWTETVSPHWWRDPAGLGLFARDALRIRHHPALGVWQVTGAPAPGLWGLVLRPVPRLAVGWSFLSHMGLSPRYHLEGPDGWQRWARLPGSHSGTVGVRVATAPRELVRALCAWRGPVGREDREQIERFAGRPRHGAILRAAWLREQPADPGEAGRVLREALDL